MNGLIFLCLFVFINMAYDGFIRLIYDFQYIFYLLNCWQWLTTIAVRGSCGWSLSLKCGGPA